MSNNTHMRGTMEYCPWSVKGRTKGLLSGDIRFKGKWTGYIEMERKGSEPDKLLSMVWWNAPALEKVVPPVAMQSDSESRREALA